MYKICFYVPETHLEEVKNALFAAGAGKIGHYGSCAWQTRGEGQFMPLEGSKAFIGKQDALERIVEFKVELVCADNHLEAAVAALKKAHPYEEPAFAVWRLADL